MQGSSRRWPSCHFWILNPNGFLWTPEPPPVAREPAEDRKGRCADRSSHLEDLLGGTLRPTRREENVLAGTVAPLRSETSARTRPPRGLGVACKYIGSNTSTSARAGERVPIRR